MLYRKALPTQERLAELLEYHPDTGKLYWKKRQVREGERASRVKSWNTRYAGKETGIKLIKPELGDSSYRSISIDNQVFTTHRIIYKLAHNLEPQEIDHDNRNRADNRLVNLVASDHVTNNKNQKLRSTNKTGTMGISWQAHANKWKVKISNKHIGYASTKEEAIAMREQAMLKHNYHPNHGK